MDTLFIFGAKYLWLVAIFFGGALFIFMERKKQKEIILLSIIAFPFSYIVAKLAGFFYYNPQPFVVDNFTPLISHVADNGFPSDHTLLLATLAFVIFLINRKIGAVLFLFALAVGISRVFAGLHHSVDIAASFLIPMVVVSIAYYLLKRAR